MVLESENDLRLGDTIPAQASVYDRRGSLVDSFDVTTGWAPTNCTLSASNAWTSDGGGSMLITGTGTGLNADIVKVSLPRPIDLANFQCLDIDVNLGPWPGTANAAMGNILISMGIGGFTNFFQATSDKAGEGPRPGVTKRLRFTKNDFVANGTATWTGFADQIFIRFVGTTGKTTTSYIDNMRVNPIRSKAGWVIRADDAWNVHFSYLFNACASRGIPLNLFPPTSFIGGGNRFTYSQLDTMLASPLVTLHNHTDQHTRFSQQNSTQAQCFADFDTARAILLARGYNAENLKYTATPGGETTQNCELALIQYGALANHDARHGTFQRSYDGQLENFHIPAIQLSCLGNAVDFATFKPYMDSNREAGTIMEIVIHNCTTTPSVGVDVAQTVVTSILDYIQAGMALGEKAYSIAGLHNDMMAGAI